MSTGSDQQRRGYWMRTLHQWHWISSAICLIGLLIFTVTGFTLNHAAQIEGEPVRTQGNAVLPPGMLATLKGSDSDPLPVRVSSWLSAQSKQPIQRGTVEWTDADVTVSMPTAGGDAWLSVDRESGDVEWETTDRGAISFLNDLHKGRNTGAVWKWFIDIFALGCLVFCISGLFLLYFHARQRRLTWPMVGAGLVIPVLLLLLFLH